VYLLTGDGTRAGRSFKSGRRRLYYVLSGNRLWR